MISKAIIKVLYFIAVMGVMVGFGGMAGWVETGSGLFQSATVLIIGLTAGYIAYQFDWDDYDD